MTSPDSVSPNDELDNLVRGALNARVTGLEPPQCVWNRIECQLRAGSALPPRTRAPWSPLLLQAVLTLVLLMLGGVGLQTLLNGESLSDPSDDLRPLVTMVSMQEGARSPVVVMPNDRAELRLLKEASRSSPAHQVAAELVSEPPVAVPPDVPPNVFSPQGRALKSELAWRQLAADEQRRLHSGPYPWFR